jgi:hypothetical protein
VGLTAFAATLAMRNNAWLGMAAALLIADTAGGWIPTKPVTAGFLRVAAVAALTLAALGVGRLALENSARFETLVPRREIAAVASYASSHPCSRALGDIVTVSGLLWQDPWMAGRVGFDGRIEAYPPRALSAWVAFESADGPRSLDLARNYQLLIASSHSPALVRRLAHLTGGSTLARDGRGIAVLHRTAVARPCAAP